MSTRPRFLPIVTPLLGLLILGACSQEVLTPEASAPSLAFAPPEPESCRPSINGNGTELFGLRHYPLGKARLSVNSNGDLVIANLRKSGDDGSCTQGPAAGKVRVVLATPPNVMNGDALSFEFRRCDSPLCNGWGMVLRRNDNGILRAIYRPNCGCDNTTSLLRNGQRMRSRQGSGPLSLPLPSGFLLHDVGTGDGIVTMRGSDAAGNNWVVRVVPGEPLPTVNELKFLARFRNGPQSVVYQKVVWQ